MELFPFCGYVHAMCVYQLFVVRDGFCFDCELLTNLYRHFSLREPLREAESVVALPSS